jgi:hypothetical protein
MKTTEQENSMTTTPKTTTPKTMTDGTGAEIPVRYVKPYDRLRDKIARRIARRFMGAREVLEAAYRDTLADIDELRETVAEGGWKLGGPKGNLQFQSFDQLIQVGIEARYNMEFDERLSHARVRIEKFIEDKTCSVDADLRELVLMAFRPTSDGLLSRARILGLLRLNIRHPDWAAAMDLIRESINTARGKNLLRVERRANRDAKFERVLLNLADVCGAGAAGEKGGQP